MSEDPFEAYKRAGEEFRRSAEASARRFRSSVQRASKQMRTAEERSRLEIEQAKGAFQAELEAAKVELELHLSRFRAAYPIPPRRKTEQVNDPADAGEEFSRVTAEFQVWLDQARAESKRHKRVSRPQHAPEMARGPRNAAKKPPKRRRRGPDDGSEMAPVMPRPKPTPLMDGAEAPIE